MQRMQGKLYPPPDQCKLRDNAGKYDTNCVPAAMTPQRPCFSREGRGGRRGAAPSPCQNVSKIQQMEKLLDNNPFSTWKCHIGSNQAK